MNIINKYKKDKYESYKDLVNSEKSINNFDNNDLCEIFEYHSYFYKKEIYNFYKDLINSEKCIDDYDGNDLWKILEYYSCIKLSEKYNTIFYEYNDIDPTFKEINNMSRNDTGIDACDLKDKILQCKFRKNTLTLKECSTFFACQNIFSEELQKTIVRWEKMIISRNSESILSDHLLEKKKFKLFEDITFPKQEIIEYCNDLLNNPILNYVFEEEEFKLRYYQLEAIEIIKNNNNSIICLPTGCGKNIVIMYSMKEDKKYLILVPRIILMYQLKDEMIKHFPKWKNKIQLIGDNNNCFKENKNITICVYNSVNLIMDYASQFEKIYIDEAHHIEKPEIYKSDDDYESIEEEYHESINEDDERIDEYNEIIEEDDESIDKDDESIEKSKDDSEDELKNSKYIDIIHGFKKFNNNVYLSATIDELNNFEYYKKDIREMIEKKYLSDYTIHVPIFNEDPTNKNICEYIIKNYRNMIIYCNTQKEGKEVNKIMNKILNKSSEYIDCLTSKNKRTDIINRFKKSSLPFIVNVRILVEGFDAPITKGVIFMHLPRSKTTLIQIIGRCLRLHENKTISNVILPYSCNEDKDNINNFLRIIAENDNRIKKSFENKKLGGYISLNIEESNNEEELNEEIELKFEMIYNSMGFLQNGNELWNVKLNKLKEFIDEYKKLPNSRSKNSNEKVLGKWISHQKTYYKNKEYIMKDETIYNKWSEFIEEYKKYFFSNEEIWKANLDNVKIFINEYKKLPSKASKNSNKKVLGKWISTQKSNYKNKIKIMKDETIYNTWSEFIEIYKIYFLSNEEIWKDNLDNVKIFINEYKKLPSEASKNSNEKILRTWLSNQKKNYKNKTQIMKDETIYNTWTHFIEECKKYFLSNEEIWKDKLDNVKIFIDEKKKIPSTTSKNSNEKILGIWLSHQKINYKNKTEIMKDENIYNTWTEFIKIYKKYFLSNEEIWKDNLDNVKIFINEYKKLPSEASKNSNEKILRTWLSNQKKNYKNKTQIMKDETIYNTWTHFIEECKKYFLSNEEIWKDNLDNVKTFINEYKKLPSEASKNSNEKILGRWLSRQKINYKNKTQIMKDETIYNTWSKFIEIYKKYL